MIGIALGLLIGFVSLVPFTLLVGTGHRLIREPEISMGNLITILGELLAMPTFWFGGPWLSSKIIAALDWEELMEPYVLALAVTFVLPALVLVVVLIIKTAGEMAQSTGSLQRGRP